MSEAKTALEIVKSEEDGAAKTPEILLTEPWTGMMVDTLRALQLAQMQVALAQKNRECAYYEIAAKLNININDYDPAWLDNGSVKFVKKKE